MALAQFKKVYGKNGAGRFVVSEGIAPSCYLLPHEGLPTLYHDSEDDRFEVVIPMGTILTVVEDPRNGDARIVPATGGDAVTWGADDTVTVNQANVLDDPADIGDDPGVDATPGTLDDIPDGDPVTVTAGTRDTGDEANTVVIPAGRVPIGCAQYDLYRPFDKGTSQGAGWIARGYVEWPVVAGVNGDLAIGDLVASDFMGRPVVGNDAPYEQTVGRVIERELFATNFDGGLLSYMQLGSDPGALKAVYEITKAGPYQGKMGIRGNLDVTNVIGAVRVNLHL